MNQTNQFQLEQVQDINNNALAMEEKLRQVVNKHEISQHFVNKLQLLQTYKIVYIFDDSGSMNASLLESPLNNNNNLVKATRWDELKYFASISIEIASIFNSNGCDIYFLNRFPSPVKNILDSSQLVNYFRDKPAGLTPISRVLNQVLTDNPPQVLGERNLLIILATDGEPTNQQGQVDTNEFKNILISRPNCVFTNIVCCTDDDDSIGYLNVFDKQIPRLDVVDDYRTERADIKRIRGANFSFSFGDYVSKTMIGSIDPQTDMIDQTNDISNNPNNNNNPYINKNAESSCCIIL
jgi:hypothetical protein